MSDTPRHSVSVAAAIFDDSGENVLLIKRRDNGRWEPPGGVLELGESIEDGLRREVLEETGAEIHVGPLTGIYKNIPAGIVALVFKCELTSGATVSATAEASDVAWYDLKRVDDFMVEAYSIRILDAAGGSQSPRVRSHDGTALIVS